MKLDWKNYLRRHGVDVDKAHAQFRVYLGKFPNPVCERCKGTGYVWVDQEWPTRKENCPECTGENTCPVCGLCPPEIRINQICPENSGNITKTKKCHKSQ